MSTPENLHQPSSIQIVSILEHPKCSGTEGTIVGITPEGRKIVECKQCHSNRVIIDYRHPIRSRL